MKEQIIINDRNELHQHLYNIEMSDVLLIENFDFRVPISIDSSDSLNENFFGYSGKFKRFEIKNCTFTSINFITKDSRVRVGLTFESCKINFINVDHLIFEKPVKFFDCVFKQKLKFDNTSFESLVDFFDCTFKASVNFYKTDFNGNAVFASATFEQM